MHICIRDCAYSAGLRIFPAVLWAGPLAIIAWDIYRKRRLQRSYLKFLAGGAAAVLVLVPLSLHVTGGVHSYEEFMHHIKVHQNTALTNHVGLHTVIKASPEGRMKYARHNALLDPFGRRIEHRGEPQIGHRVAGIGWSFVEACGEPVGEPPIGTETTAHRRRVERGDFDVVEHEFAGI